VFVNVFMGKMCDLAFERASLIRSSSKKHGTGVTPSAVPIASWKLTQCDVGIAMFDIVCGGLPLSCQ